MSSTSSLRNGFAVIAGGARTCARLEGWPRVPVLRPSFETLAEFIIGPRFARTRWQAPQDEVSILLSPAFAGTTHRVARSHAMNSHRFEFQTATTLTVIASQRVARMRAR